MKKALLLSLICISGFFAHGQEHFYDFIYRGADAEPTNFIEFNNEAFFTAKNGNGNHAIYKTDATPAGTEMVYEFSSSLGYFNRFTVFKDKLFFTVSTKSGIEMWYTEGEKETTKRFYKAPEFYGNRTIDLFVFNDWLFYHEQVSEDSFYVKRVDSTLNKDIVVSRNKHGYQYAKSNFISTSNYLFYAFNDKLYRIDNSFTSGKYWERSSSAGDIPYLYANNNTIIFHMRNSSKTDVYAINETGGNAQVTATLYGYPAFYDWLGNGNFFYYIAGEYNGWPKLYRLNTQNLKHKELGYAHTRDRKIDLEVYNNDVYYSAMVNGDCELYKVGNLSTAPIKVKDLANDTSGNPQSFIVYDNKLYFSAFTKNEGRELWVSEGNAGNTNRAFDFAKGAISSNLGINRIELNGKMILSGYTPYYGAEIWVSDGTEKGTEILLNINANVDRGNQQVSTFMPVGDYLYLFANDSINGAELWRTDGTETGTIPLDNINVGYLPSGMGEYIEFKEDLYGTAVSFIDGIEFYKSDGTPSGSGFVTPSDLFSSSAPRNYVVEGDYMYFIARRGLFSGDAIFKSDGTKAGTKPYLATGNNIKSIENMRKVGNKILVSITNQNDETYLYWVNTQKDKLFKYSTKASSPIQFFTESDTSMIYVYEDNKTWRLGKNNITETISGQKVSHLADVKPDTFFSSGNKEYMIGHTKNNKEIVLAFNETNLIHGVYPKEAYSNVESIIGFNSGVIFSAKHATLGQELFIYRNTDTAAVLLSDINPGSASSNPDNFYVLNDKLVFTATTSTSGTEVWLTDGTTEGTQLIWDIQPGAGSSFPTEFTSYKGYLYISASDSVRENSLYKMIVDSCDVISAEIISKSGISSFCIGDSITLIGQKGIADAKLTWLKNGQPTVTAGDTLITNEIGDYEIVVETAKCKVKSPAFKVSKALELFVRAKFESDSTACEGESISLKLLGNNINKTTWYKDNETYSSQNNTATFSSGTFYAICKNIFGCVDTTNVLTATINENPVPVLIYDYDTLKCTKEFSAYQWYFKGSPVSNETKNFIVPDENGSYKVLASDSNGCSGESIPFKYEGNSIGEFFATNALSVFPNPFSGSTQINFSLYKSSQVEIKVFNSLGKLVATIASTSLETGDHDYVFNAPNDGVYLVSVTINAETEFLKLISN